MLPTFFSIHFKTLFWGSKRIACCISKQTMSDITISISSLFDPSTAYSKDLVSFDNWKYKIDAKRPTIDKRSTHLFLFTGRAR